MFNIFYLNVNLFIFYYQISLYKVYSSSKCGGVNDEEVEFLDTGVELKRNLESNWSPIRIYFDYEDLKTRNLNQETQNAIIQIMTKTSLMIQNLIKVSPLRNKLSMKKCANLTLSSKIIEGVESDIIIVASYNSSELRQIEAYAGLCGQDSVSGRPLSGYVSFTKNLDISKVNWLEYNTYLAFHEITHIMVFNRRLFSFFKDVKGIPIPMDNIISNITINNLTRVMLKTPKVLDYARRHFNCNNIDGMELENQGGRGTVMNHWEARLMLSDYMIGFGYDDNTISEMTLALFEDSGWYKVNYYTGGLFRWGKGQGCSFLNTTCIISGSVRFNNEFCYDMNIPTCSNSRMAKGICSLKKSNETNSSYNYNTEYTGSIELIDYCPVSKSLTVKNYYLGLNCIYGINTYNYDLWESISNKSACFISSLIDNKNKAICYEYKCDFINKLLTVYIGKSSTSCPINGGLAKVDGMSGVLYCPDFNRLCTKKTECNSMIDCAMNKVIADSNSFFFNYKPININPTGENTLLSSISANKILNVFLYMLILIILI